VLKMVIKVSDIGNVTKGKDYCLKWTERVIEEFQAQGDLEGQLKLPVTPFMDRKTANVPKQQIGFYNFVAKPMFEAMDLLIPMDGPLANLNTMEEHWSAQMSSADTQSVSTPTPTRRLSVAPARMSVSSTAAQQRQSVSSRISRRVSSQSQGRASRVTPFPVGKQSSDSAST